MSTIPDYSNLRNGQANGDQEDDHSKSKSGYRSDPEIAALRTFFIHIGLVVGLFFIWLTFKLADPQHKPPDFTNYTYLHSLDGATLNLTGEDRRVIMVGDLHGMLHSFDNLAEKLHYDSRNDLLIHMGDIVAKGPHSNELLSRFASENIAGVRGNNDQKVIEWYGWISWVLSHRDGERFLLDLEAQHISTKRAKHMELWKNIRYPFLEDWEWNSDHYHIARRMSPSDYAYLSSLPIIIHLPSIHTFMVHGGLLPADFTHHLHWKRQPLAVSPDLPLNPTAQDIESARNEQELSLLTGVEANRDAFLVMNLRDLHDLRPSRRGPKHHDDTVPWSEAWSDVIKRCGGFVDDKKRKKKKPKVQSNQGGIPDPEHDSQTSSDAHFQTDLTKKKSLPCHPITVVFSHASGRGLDLKKWSKGLDTGCVNGNGLTAMILGEGRHRWPEPIPDHSKKKRQDGDDDDDDDERDIEVPFGEDLEARLVTVSCPTLEEL